MLFIVQNVSKDLTAELICYICAHGESGNKIRHLLVDPILLVGRIDKHVGILLALRNIRHIDIDSASGHALRNAVGVESLGLEGRVAHEQGSSGHVGDDVRVGVAVRLQSFSAFSHQARNSSRLC